MPEDWELLKSFLPGNWRELARETGALKGLRKDKSEEQLLRVLLMHLGCGYSLRETVLRAKRAGLAELSDVALLKRLRKSGEWLRRLCVELYGEGEQRALPGTVVEARVVDATTVKEPGKSGSLWRLHYAVRLPSLSCDFFKVTGTEGSGSGESLTHFPVREGDLVLADRGYSLAPGIVQVAAAGGYVTVRVNTRALVLATPMGEPLELLARGQFAATRGSGRVLGGAGGGEGGRDGAGPGVRGAQEPGGHPAGAAGRFGGAPAGRGNGSSRRPWSSPGSSSCSPRSPRRTFPRRRSWSGIGRGGRSSWSSSGSSPWRSSVICPNTTTTAPGHGSMESCCWLCWWRRSSATPSPFPPGDTSWRRRRPQSIWREFEFALSEVAAAIRPVSALSDMVQDWAEISRALAEPPRRRMPQLVNLYG